MITCITRSRSCAVNSTTDIQHKMDKLKKLFRPAAAPANKPPIDSTRRNKQTTIVNKKKEVRDVSLPRFTSVENLDKVKPKLKENETSGKAVKLCASASGSVDNIAALKEEEHETKSARISKSSSSANLTKVKQEDNKVNGNKRLRTLGLQQVPSKKVNKLPSQTDIKSKMEQMAQEKLEIEERLTQNIKERESEIECLKCEIGKLRDEKCLKLDELNNENHTLRARLRDVTHSPESESERFHNSAPPSIAPNNDLACTELDCPTPDWDKHSCSSLSEVSVACLQDRIMQMEETHYSTNEELQATIQELSDLQTQLTELQSDNERLRDEKNVLLESLCRQTEKLEDCRARVDTLQELLLKGKEGDSCTEREQKLVELLKSAQEERETLLLKQEELNSQLNELRNAADCGGLETGRLKERVTLLESTVDATHAERKQLDQELALAKEESNSRLIEINRLNTLLDNARAKIEELEQARRTLGDKSDLDEIIDNARKEKDGLESEVANLQDQVSRSQCQVNKVREQLRQLQEECKVTRNNAKSAISNLEYEVEQLKAEKTNLTQELVEQRELTSELHVQSQCHLDDKIQLKGVLTETQKHLVQLEKDMLELERKYREEKKLREDESIEWQQFQSDLLMTVRVANDFKTEAQHELEKLVMENKALRDKVRSLEAQIDKLKVKSPSPPPSLTPTETSVSVLSSVQQDLARRTKSGISRQDSRLSVKSLIESIENATKQAKAGPGSRSSSTSSLSSIASDVRCPNTNSMQNRHYSESDVFQPIKTPLKDQQTNNKIQTLSLNNKGRKAFMSDGCVKPDVVLTNRDIITPMSILSNKNIDRRSSYSDLISVSGERKDPLSSLVKNGGSKRNALLKWCQNKTIGYKNIDITNFSSSWNDGLGFCALLHTFLPDRVPYDTLSPNEKRRNFTIAFEAAESVGIPTTLNITEMIQIERPDWQQVMAYITAIYKHFET